MFHQAQSQHTFIADPMLVAVFGRTHQSLTTQPPAGEHVCSTIVPPSLSAPHNTNTATRMKLGTENADDCTSFVVLHWYTETDGAERQPHRTTCERDTYTRAERQRHTIADRRLRAVRPFDRSQQQQSSMRQTLGSLLLVQTLKMSCRLWLSQPAAAQAAVSGALANTQAQTRRSERNETFLLLYIRP